MESIHVVSDYLYAHPSLVGKNDPKLSYPVALLGSIGLAIRTGRPALSNPPSPSPAFDRARPAPVWLAGGLETQAAGST